VSVFVAIETATDHGSIAIGSGAGVVGEVSLGVRSRHAESLLPALEFLLRAGRLGRRDIEGIVVGAGPGSFTGVRVAAATARGLAHGLAVPLHAFSSLAALALEDGAATPTCALFDARRGEVYAACYVRDGESDALRTLLEPDVLSVRELLRRVAGLDPRYSGEGAVRYAAELGIASPPPRVPRASGLLRLAAAQPGAGRIEDSAGWEPAYLRSSGAERGVAG
jgi:tRNA threonylcarbamoyladenosine biosynthesis protein TsaB